MSGQLLSCQNDTTAPTSTAATTADTTTPTEGKIQLPVFLFLKI